MISCRLGYISQFVSSAFKRTAHTHTHTHTRAHANTHACTHVHTHSHAHTYTSRSPVPLTCSLRSLLHLIMSAREHTQGRQREYHTFPTTQLPEVLTYQVVAGRAVTPTAETAARVCALRLELACYDMCARPYPLALGACRPGAAALDSGQDWSKQ